GLGQYFVEHHQQHGHEEGRIDHPHLTEPRQEYSRGQRRCGNVGGVVAQQQCADEPLPRLQQAIDDRGPLVALLLEPQHARPRRSGERRLARGEEKREQDADQNDEDGEPVLKVHGCSSFSARKARTCAGSMSAATKLAPMPRARMKVSFPRRTFLSWAMRSMSPSAPTGPPGTEAGCVGRPTVARCRATRSASPCGSSPSRAENAKASASPMATASPWSRRSENPAAASKACANVWPRLSRARSPDSRSSRTMIAALARQLVVIACSRAGVLANTSRQFASSQAKNPASLIRPYLTTSA